MNKKKKIRAIMTIGASLFSIMFYIWYIERNSPDWFKGIFFWFVCIGIPIYSIAKEQRSFPEFSLDWDKFLQCLRGIVWFTLFGTIFFVALALYNETINYDHIFLRRVFEYFFWSFLQQIGLQTFLTTRVKRIVKNHYGTALVSSVLFALLHSPNISLVVFSGVGGFFWSLIYLRTPNLYALAVSHGWLAVLALHCVPPSWLHGLRIGPTYWNF